MTDKELRFKCVELLYEHVGTVAEALKQAKIIYDFIVEDELNNKLSTDESIQKIISQNIKFSKKK